MSAQELLDEILPILYGVKDDKVKLQKILDYLYEEIHDFSTSSSQELPEKYKKVVVEIANSIDAGFICFLNLETTEFEELPHEMLFDPEYFEKNTSEYFSNMKIVHHEWEKCMRFEPLENYDIIQLRRQFTGLIEDRKLCKHLLSVIEHPNHDSDFDDLINRTEHAQSWENFKTRYLQNHVTDLLKFELEKVLPEEFSKMVNSFFEVHEEAAESEIVPIPHLCTLCKIYKRKDHKENLMCTLKRFNQRTDEHFTCVSFEKA